MKHRRFLTAIVILICSATPVLAAKWGAKSTAFMTDVYPNGVERNTTLIEQGGPGVQVVNAELHDGLLVDSEGNGPHSRGLVQGAAGLKRFPANAPGLLQASAITWGNTSGKPHLGELPSGAVAGATAFTSEMFRFLGTAPITLSLTFDLEYAVGNFPTDPTGLTGVRAEFAVFPFTPNYQFVDDLDALINDHGITPLDTDEIAVANHTGFHRFDHATLEFDVSPGDIFFVWQKLTASAVRGSRVADIYAPMESGFNHPELVESITIVPEPATTNLVGVVWLALSAWRRASAR
jgi:hypothetical protein